MTGDAASVKVVEIHPKLVYTNYLNVLPVAWQWRIMNKIHTRRPRQLKREALGSCTTVGE